MKKKHGIQFKESPADLVDMFIPFIVGDTRAFNVIDTENFKDFLEKFVEKL